MSSSLFAGERRWASARKSGMTVLGKVTAPKPINLPSQRLENHGLDPNAEIVPKGSHSWGSRSSASNPWGSSAVSPNADGTVSPSHLSGRPSSSGGSGTRPSTAGSDRTHEVGGSAWGPNSRPSSASGLLTSNQASLASSRPRTPETRPGSAQLSRFADPAADGSVAWGSTGTVDKLVLNSKSDNFSLSSGDFPTLGKNPDFEDNHSHARPRSASGRVASPNDRAQTDVKGGTIDTWTRDGAQHAEDGVHPSAEKWHGDHSQYFNPNMPPQHFDAWRGPPMNPPAGVWYGGPPGGPPYPPVAHGGFPMEPFPYYHPQIAPALPNPQPVPPRGPGPRGHHPKNGDFYRPQMPDAFMRPGLPMRPGFYPGSVPYDGYYGPPMGYNPNERDIPFMGMPGGPPIYNMYPPQKSSEPGDIQTRVGGRGTGGKRLVTEHAELGHSDVARGPYKVLKKRPNEWGLEVVEEENLEPTASATALHLEKGEQPRKALLKNETGADNRTDEEFSSGRTAHGENHSSRTRSGHYSDPSILKSPRDKSKAVDDSWGKKSEIAEVHQALPAVSKDITLIQKIEMLNAKVRAFDGREDIAPSSVGEEQMNRVQLVNSKMNNDSRNEAGFTPGDSISSSLEPGGSTEEITSQAAADTVPAISRRVHAGVHGRMDQHHKGRYSNYDADGRRKKTPSLVAESTATVPAVNNVTVESAETSEIRIMGKNEEESLTPMYEPIDGQAQRAKLRELAKQRAIQLQKEEEERIREQKAKALAKLEELNRRTLAGDNSAQKLEMPVTSGAAQKDSDESNKHPDPAVDADKHVNEQLRKPLTSNALVVVQTSVGSTGGVGESSVLSKHLHFEAPNDTSQEPVVPHSESIPSKLDVVNAGVEDSKTVSNDVGLRRNKRNKQKQSIYVESVAGGIQKQRIQVESAVTDNPISISTSEGQKDHDVGATEFVTSQVDPMYAPSLPNNSSITQESVGHNKRKNNRSSRSKHKQDEAASSTASQSTVTQEIHLTKAPASAASNEPHPSKASASASSQSPVPKESVPANPSDSSTFLTPGAKETQPAKTFAAAASQSLVQKETLPAKTSTVGASQPPVWKETRPAKASATATSQPLVSKDTLSAKASGTAGSQSPLPKENYAVKTSAASQSSMPKETHPSKVLPSAFSHSSVTNEAHRAIASVSASSPSPVPKGSHPVKAPLERGQPKDSQLELDPNSVQLVTDGKDANQQPSSDQIPSLPNEEAYSRVNNQWKLQNPRRMPRNPQALRSGDKFHSSESVVWAPVRSQNKLEPEGEGSHKAAPDATPAAAGNDNPVQSSVKSKRAELERYVPKPAAKELAQQGNIQQPVPLSSSISNETSEREGSGSQSVKPEVGNGMSSVEPRNGDFKQSKPTRTPASWRQRGSSEAQHEKSIQHTSYSTSNPTHNVQKFMNQQEASNMDFNFVPAENKVVHEWDPSDGWSMPPEPSATSTVTHVVKDEGVGTGKGRRQLQPHKGHRSTVNSHDLDHNQSAATDISQAEHWQPKSQAYLASNQRGNRYRGGQKDNFEVKENSSPRATQQDHKESSEITHQPPSEQFRQEEGRRERRSDSSRRHPRTPSQSLGSHDNMEEQAADYHYSGFRRGGAQNNRGTGRGNESRRDWSAGGHENRQPQQHVGPSRDRQSQNAHFEYQPVGSNSNNEKFNNFDGEGSRNMGQRYRERGSGRPRRGAGNFHGQQSGRPESGND